MNSIADFGVLDGPRFGTCAACGGVVALPDGAHMDAQGCQAQDDDVLRDDNESVACIPQVLSK